MISQNLPVRVGPSREGSACISFQRFSAPHSLFMPGRFCRAHDLSHIAPRRHPPATTGSSHTSIWSCPAGDLTHKTLVTNKNNNLLRGEKICSIVKVKSATSSSHRRENSASA